jgi:hypothetical protein
LATQLAELQDTSAVKSSPYGESPGVLLDPKVSKIFHPLKFELEYVVVPEPAAVTVVAPVLAIWIESADATEAMEAISKAHKNKVFIEFSLLPLIYYLEAF